MRSILALILASTMTAVSWPGMGCAQDSGFVSRLNILPVVPHPAALGFDAWLHDEPDGGGQRGRSARHVHGGIVVSAGRRIAG